MNMTIYNGDSAVRHPEVEVRLSAGQDSNAGAIIGAVSRALRRAGVPSAELTEFAAEATSGDYDNVLATCMRWVEVS
jgi:hypothetical protein